MPVLSPESGQSASLRAQQYRVLKGTWECGACPAVFIVRLGMTQFPAPYISEGKQYFFVFGLQEFWFWLSLLLPWTSTNLSLFPHLSLAKIGFWVNETVHIRMSGNLRGIIQM